MGGDEFCVLAPNQTASRAGVLGERLSAAIAALEGDEGMYRAKASGERVALGAPEAVSEPGGDGARSG